MRSQKQNNRSPRPFKNQFADGKRGGAGRDMGFIPGGSKFAAAKKKTVTEQPPTTPDDKAKEE